jgi:hypothetical protein
MMFASREGPHPFCYLFFFVNEFCTFWNIWQLCASCGMTRVETAEKSLLLAFFRRERP